MVSSCFFRTQREHITLDLTSYNEWEFVRNLCRLCNIWNKNHLVSSPVPDNTSAGIALIKLSSFVGLSASLISAVVISPSSRTQKLRYYVDLTGTLIWQVAFWTENWLNLRGQIFVNEVVECRVGSADVKALRSGLDRDRNEPNSTQLCIYSRSLRCTPWRQRPVSWGAEADGPSDEE